MPVGTLSTTREPDVLDPVMVHPPKNIEERLRDVIESLRSVPGFVSAAVTRRDGLVIKHSFARVREAAGLCAMAAAMVGAARATGVELGQGVPEYGFFQFHSGILVIQDAGPEAILACLIRKDTDLGVAIPHISHASDTIRETLEAL